MRAAFGLFAVGLFTLAVCINTNASEREMDADTHIEVLKEEVANLRREMAEMKNEHEREMRALREQMAQLLAGKSAPAASVEKGEIAALRDLAEAAAKEEPGEEAEAAETVFKAGGLGLQALNPEISVTGDMVTTLYRHQDGSRKRHDFNFRNLALHLESYLDPYTKFKAALPVTKDWAKIGEAYMTRYGIADGVNVTFGKFRQQFGVVNRWHKHALDQVDFPLALRQIFGNGGLNQTGVSLDWTMPPCGDSSQELVLQVTNGENGRLFAGNAISNPSCLVRYKNYRDLSKDTYAELGFTGLVGWNDEWDVQSSSGTDTIFDSRATRVYGLDFSVLWEPTERMRYRNVEWRSEAFLLDRDIHAPDGSGKDSIFAWGAYTYLQTKLSRTVDVGVRLDYYEPDRKDYASLGLAPLAYTEHSNWWQVSPYLTWYQSPFVHYRFEYDHLDGHNMKNPEDALMFQVIFAAGPHKHERY